MTSDEPAIGAVDWGGTWIRAAMVAGDRIVHSERAARPPALPQQYEVVADLMRRCAAAVGRPPAAIGVGIAGIVQRGLVVSALNLGINSPTDVAGGIRSAAEVAGGISSAAEVAGGISSAAGVAGGVGSAAEVVGGVGSAAGGVGSAAGGVGDVAGVPIFVVNDLQATAIGVAGRWPDGLTAVMSMGTGVGGAVLDRGRLLAGEGAAGDFGHIPVQPDGPSCPCGGAGCLEMLVSGRVLSEVARQLGDTGRSPFLTARLSGGRPLHAGDLQDATDAGDEAAIAALERAAATFAAGLRTIVATVDPARILLAGALLAEDAAFGRMVRLRWEAARPFWCRTPLIHVPDDVDAALRGAASFAASFGSNIRPANGREM